MISVRSKVTQKVLSYFFIHEGDSLYINEMARLLKLDRGNLIKKVRLLEKEGILQSEFRGNQKYCFLNKKYPLLKEYKKIILKTIGFESEARKLLKTINGVKEAYIFGSYAKDNLGASSDIDILVIGHQDTIELQRGISKLQREINREINVVSLGEEEFIEKKKKKDPFIMGILRSKNIKIL